MQTRPTAGIYECYSTNIDGRCIDLLLDKLVTLLDEYVTEHEVE